MYAYRARSLAFPWPPLLCVAAILTALILDRLLPVAVINSNGWTPMLAGSAIAATGLCLDIWAMRTLLDCHTTILPQRCSAHLVAFGPFRLTRNPSYLGYVMIMAGIGLITLNPWQLLLSCAAVILLTLSAVASEELHLLSRFGVEFERYRRKTSRWI